MTQTAILRWRSERMARMADLYGLYDDASNTTGDARPAAVDQLRLMLAVALAAGCRAIRVKGFPRARSAQHGRT
jgi:hypothetical protein